ncbi:MAG: acetyl-CoA carboxylase biotin carboxyl carrier protein [Bacteroidetes bacterium]|nr:MAG: acetyl-CoA carboxylase biotin carboxyl carrier protein [Bacteroidota bacterium]
MNLDRLREIIDLVAESGVSEIEIEEEGLRIVVRKNSPVAAPVAPIVQPLVAQFPAAGLELTPSGSNSEVDAAAPAKTGTEIHAPIVGTYYESANPESDPFVRVGQSVKPGDILCIIEAMKLMNEIECEVAGVITEILIENANPVEFDQPLFIIETS